MKNLITAVLILLLGTSVYSQDYFYKNQGPFNSKIPSPEQFLGYPIGKYHTRHDRVVAYFKTLASLSNKATLTIYGKTHEQRELVILNVSTTQNIKNLETLRQKHLKLVDVNSPLGDISQLPVFINLGYNVHGNEPSSTEAAMLTAYTLIASQNPSVKAYLEKAVVFIDPTINPDGRDRFVNWVNTRRGTPLVADKYDMEHNEDWPRGRTNHYWFDLNRDWLLAVNPESQGKLKWYHKWYPNVVTDFHEMGTNSSYFFEPMKPIASKDPIMPKENYTTLNDMFAKQFSADLNKIGSFYFTKEAFDGTYPGYGSSYPDLQGALALLFEQASSRGHVQETDMGKIEFKFTIRNHYVSSFATIKAAIANKDYLNKYEHHFFTSAIKNAEKDPVKAYVFGDNYDKNRVKDFVNLLLQHKIKVYNLNKSLRLNNKTFRKGKAFIVPTKQPQYRMVQTMFETYNQYRDSVYYDASAWSTVNFYNMTYAKVTNSFKKGSEINSTDNLVTTNSFNKSNYAYLIKWDDYNAPALLYFLQKNGIKLKASFKPFSITANSKVTNFDRGTLLIPISLQSLTSDKVYNLLKTASNKFKVQAFSVNTGYSVKGIDLGSRNFRTLKEPKALMLVGNGVSSYEAGEVWHALDTKIFMPITKVPLNIFSRVDLNRYNTFVLVSGSYSQLDDKQITRIKNWVAQGNTLITSRQASSWAIKKKLVKEVLIKKDTSKNTKRLPYGDASEYIGRNQIGGAIFKVDLDLTHPLAFGYHQKQIPVYKNNNIWLKPSKSAYATVAKYDRHPHIDGFITKKNLEIMKKSASLIVSPIGRGRVVMFADNPNFRGAWYGTNKLFFNALFFGSEINVPKN
ncbi:MAG: M14 family zinc carboxypeptidase [Flavobacteriaceae bacterium]